MTVDHAIAAVILLVIADFPVAADGSRTLRIEAVDKAVAVIVCSIGTILNLAVHGQNTDGVLTVGQTIAVVVVDTILRLALGIIYTFGIMAIDQSIAVVIRVIFAPIWNTEFRIFTFRIIAIDESIIIIHPTATPLTVDIKNRNDIEMIIQSDMLTVDNGHGLLSIIIQWNRGI